jgi:Cys-tRNA(Pro)/Cys-tRNA(Cys) deacylase
MASKARRKLQSQRQLEAAGVPYELVEFDPSIRSATLVAESAGHDPAGVFKTLVAIEARAGAKPVLAVIPSDRELDLKMLAKRMNVRKVAMAGHSEAERLTGLKVGGISAVALLDRGWSVYLDASAEHLESILVSAGERGFDVSLAPKDFVRVTGASFEALTS